MNSSIVPQGIFRPLQIILFLFKSQSAKKLHFFSIFEQKLGAEASQDFLFHQDKLLTFQSRVIQNFFYFYFHIFSYLYNPSLASGLQRVLLFQENILSTL